MKFKYHPKYPKIIVSTVEPQAENPSGKMVYVSQLAILPQVNLNRTRPIFII